MVKKNTRTDSISKKIDQVVWKHLRRLKRIQPDAPVQRVQTYMDGMKASFMDSGNGFSTLYLELGNQSSGAFAYRTDEFLSDLAECCGEKIDNVFIIETDFDIRNKGRCLATLAVNFNNLSLAEWSKTDGEGLRMDITTRRWEASGEWTVVKAIHIRRLADGTSSVTLELPELYAALDQVIKKNFGAMLVDWLRDDVKVSQFAMEPDEKRLKCVLDRFKTKVLEPKELQEEIENISFVPKEALSQRGAA